MNHRDRALLTDVQEFLIEEVLHDATATAHHEKAGALYSRAHVHTTRPRPFLEHYLKWRIGPENTVRENPKAEIMVYTGLFPGRVHDLLLELLS